MVGKKSLEEGAEERAMKTDNQRAEVEAQEK